ncbi:MAG: ABC transporter substrate-binding protein [Pseudolabrys sp.]
MIRAALALLSLIAVSVSAAAQERVTVGTMRAVSNSALFVAAAEGYFKAEGLDVDMTAYQTEKDVADAVASGATDFGLGAFTPAAYSYASRGLMKAVAAQVREKADYEGNQVIVSNHAYARGVRKLENLANLPVAVTQIGSAFHYQVGQIARVKKFDFKSVTIKPLQTYDAIAREIGNGKVDAAILPGHYARELLVASQAKLVGWVSEVDEQQFGALFVSAKALAERREVVDKFVRAYRRGVADYYQAFMRHDRYGKRISNSRSREVATLIARYVFPGKPIGTAAATVESSAYFMDPQGRLDAADVARQVEWFKALGLVEASVDAAKIIDASFTPAAARTR